MHSIAEARRDPAAADRLLKALDALFRRRRIEPPRSIAHRPADQVKRSAVLALEARVEQWARFRLAGGIAQMIDDDVELVLWSDGPQVHARRQGIEILAGRSSGHAGSTEGPEKIAAGPAPEVLRRCVDRYCVTGELEIPGQRPAYRQSERGRRLEHKPLKAPLALPRGLSEQNLDFGSLRDAGRERPRDQH